MILISVSWLGTADAPRYHGKEWPPAPLRVFQAMVASAGRTDRTAKQRAFETLGRLENAPPPTIYAPEPQWAEPVASAVPNNDADMVWRHRAQRRFLDAREAEAKSKAIRQRRGRIVDGPVHYLWDADLTAEDMSVLRELAAGVTHVGQGIDLAAVTVQMAAAGVAGTVHRPDPRVANLLQVPYPGVLEVLEERYQHERGRVAGVGGSTVVADSKRVVHVEHGYAGGTDVPKNRYATYRLVVGRRTWMASPDGGLAVAAMLRHAVGEAGGEAGLGRDDMAEVMGHAGPGRIHAIPLPNVGHPWADGAVRRVMVASGLDVPEDVWNAIIRRLPGRELEPDTADDSRARPSAGTSASAVVLEPGEDSVTGRYTECSSTWTTATAVVLPGLDHRRGKPRPGRTTRRLLRFAGIPEQAVTAIDYHKVGRIRGTDIASTTRVPAHLAHYPRTHMTVQFGSPLSGPLFLGAGVGWGLGLLAACER